MNIIRELFIKQGRNPDRLDNELDYLGEIALVSAEEIDSYRIGDENRFAGFDHTKELVNILKKYQLTDTSGFEERYRFPYIPIRRCMIGNSNKKLAKYPELALEMRLLRSELEHITSSSEERQLEITSFLFELSGALLTEYDNLHTQIPQH